MSNCHPYQVPGLRRLRDAAFCAQVRADPFLVVLLAPRTAVLLPTALV